MTSDKTDWKNPKQPELAGKNEVKSSREFVTRRQLRAPVAVCQVCADVDMHIALGQTEVALLVFQDSVESGMVHVEKERVLELDILGSYNPACIRVGQRVRRSPMI